MRDERVKNEYGSDRSGQTVSSFTIRKEIKCIDETVSQEQYLRLFRLRDQRESFGLVHIPWFTYGKRDNIVWYESDFIKGRVCSESEMREVVWKHCVLRDDKFTVTNFDPRNFIVCDKTKDIYYIDLNDCGVMYIKERVNRFNEQVKSYYEINRT